MGSKNWAAAEVVNASDFNAFLANQVVMVFADATARDAGFGGSGEPTLGEGMVCYLSDTNEVQVYGGSAWATIADADVMVVDSANGRVGIGNAAPTNKLTVDGGITVGSTTGTWEAGALGFTDSNWGFVFYPPQAGAIAAHAFASSAGSTLMSITDAGNVGIGTTTPNNSLSFGTPAADSRQIALYENGTAYYGIGTDVNRLSFYASNTAATAERMSIASNGDISVKSAGIKFTGATIVGNDNSCGMRWNSPNLYGTVDNAVSMVIGTTSDRRLKAEIEALDDGLSRVLELKPCSYLPLDLPQDGEEPALAGEGDIRHPGLIADEVEATEPWAVPPLVDGAYQSVNYAGLVPLLVSAIQEQQTQIDALTARIEQLEA
jgi:hypothetical protein